MTAQFLLSVLAVLDHLVYNVAHDFLGRAVLSKILHKVSFRVYQVHYDGVVHL